MITHKCIASIECLLTISLALKYWEAIVVTFPIVIRSARRQVISIVSRY